MGEKERETQERKMRRSIRFKSMNLEIPIIHAMKYDDKPKYAYRWSFGTTTHTQRQTYVENLFGTYELSVRMCVRCFLSVSLSLSLSLGWIHKFIYEFDNITTEI